MSVACSDEDDDDDARDLRVGTSIEELLKLGRVVFLRGKNEDGIDGLEARVGEGVHPVVGALVSEGADVVEIVLNVDIEVVVAAL